MIKNYLKSRAAPILYFLIIMGVFVGTGLVEGLSAAACMYALALSLFFGVVFLVCDFYRYRKKLNILEQIRHSIPYINMAYPEPSDDIETEYQAIAGILLKNISETASKLDLKRTDMVDYYTMWVHQIKTPISALGLLLQSGDIPGKEEMKLELMRIEEYVNMLLQYLRLGSENTDFLFKEQPLDPIIKDILKKYSILFIKKKIKLDYTHIDKSVMTDEKWLSFIISQVISNSLKYTKSGSISIYMDSERQDTLVIEDTGMGIRAEDLPRIFEKSFTGCNGRSEKKSTGIGLYLCRMAAEKLGHTIEAESELGAGTKIMIGLSYKNVRYE
ncbi:MAG: sensor histidine kinase [Eubacteriaceae bacterium]|nr:sensor histidine kinase [Eubacteriaceae bacterium]